MLKQQGESELLKHMSPNLYLRVYPFHLGINLVPYQARMSFYIFTFSVYG